MSAGGACHDAIPEQFPSLIVNAPGGDRWRLCHQCAPATIDGATLGWGRPSVWRASTRRDNGSGWEPIPGPPATPEDVAAAAEQHTNRMSAPYRQRQEERYARQLQRDTERRRDVEAQESALRRAYALINVLCGLAGRAAVRDNEESWAIYHTAAEALAPAVHELSRRIPGSGRRDSHETFSELLLYACQAAATEGVSMSR